MTLWNLPSGIGFLEDVRTGLERDCHLVLVLPLTILEEAPDAVSDYIYKYGGGGDLVALKSDESLHDTLCKHIGRKGDWDELLREQVDFSCVLLTGFESLSEQKQVDIIDELMHIAGVRKDSNVNWHFLLFTAPGHPNIRSDLRLKIIHWWARLSHADTEAVFHGHFSRHVTVSDVDYLWSYCLIHAFYDPELFFRVMDDPPHDLTEIQEMLESHSLFHIALEHLVYINEFRQCNDLLCFNLHNYAIPKDKNGIFLWRYGLLLHDYTLHPAALHAAKKTKNLEKCISQGQIRVLFPVIQDLHASILAYLSKNISEGWIKKIPEGELNAVRAEIGPLAYHINTNLRDCYAGKRAYGPAKAWAKIRNKIAHYTPVYYDELKSAVEQSTMILSHSADLAGRI